MVSDTAEGDIEALFARGLKPTVRDIIRLNAVALRIERGVHAAEYFALPRVAYLGQLVLCQPTIAHELWLARVRQVVEMDDDSDFACRLHVAAVAADKLVDPLDRKAVKSAVEGTLRTFGAHTFDQVRLALDYVEHGCNPDSGEHPTPEPDSDDPPPSDEDAVSVGVLHDGIACRLGLTLKDLHGMTRGELLAVVDMAVVVERGKSDRAVAQRRTDYFRTLDDITDRLEKERADG